MTTPVRPVPVPDDVTAFHWAAAREGRLDVQRCAACRSWQYPPTVACPTCQADEMVPTTVSGRGTVFSYTVVRQAFDPSLRDQIPFVVALVALAEDPSVRLLTNLVEVELDAIAIGMPVEVTFAPIGPVVLPVFRPC